MTLQADASEPWFRQIDRPQRMALTLAGLGWMFESYDSFSLSLTMPAIASDMGMAKVDIGLVLSLTAIGQMIGGICFGLVADRMGRVRTAFVCICLYSCFSGLLAFAQSFGELATLRTLGAFGMGGMWTAGAALIAETWPAGLRGRGGALMQMGLPLGALLAIGIGAIVGTTFGLAGNGWRAMYAIGALPAFILWPIARATPESPVWLARRAGTAAGHSTTPSDHAQAMFRQSFIAFLFVFCLQYVFWGVFTWSATYLVTARGMKLVGSLPYLLTLQIGALCGFLVYGAVVDRLGRRPTSGIFILVGTAAVATYAFGPDVWLLPAMFFAGFSINGVFAGMGPMIAELVPETPRRGTVMGLIYNGGRLGGVAAPTIIGLFATTSGGLAAGFGTAVIALVLALLALAALPETKGRELH